MKPTLIFIVYSCWVSVNDLTCVSWYKSTTVLLGTIPDTICLGHRASPSSTLLSNAKVFARLVKTIYTIYWLKQYIVQFSSVAQSCPTLCDPMNCSTPGLPAITNSRSSLKFMSIKSVMPSSHLILSRPLLLLPPIPPSIRVFSNEVAKVLEFQL